VLTKSLGGETFVGTLTGSTLSVQPLISSSTCLLSISRVLFTNKVELGLLAAQSAKFRNLRVISSNLVFSIMFGPSLSYTIPQRATCVHRFNTYCVGSSSNQGLLEHGYTILQIY
jgi:hypothetical protein